MLKEVVTDNSQMYPSDVANLREAVVEMQAILALLGIDSPEGITDAGDGVKLKLVVTNRVAEWVEA